MFPFLASHNCPTLRRIDLAETLSVPCSPNHFVFVLVLAGCHFVFSDLIVLICVRSFHSLYEFTLETIAQFSHLL